MNINIISVSQYDRFFYLKHQDKSFEKKPFVWTGKAQEENEDSDDEDDEDDDEVNGKDIFVESFEIIHTGYNNNFMQNSCLQNNITEELASSEDEIDEEGAQYIEKLERAVSCCHTCNFGINRSLSKYHS